MLESDSSIGISCTRGEYWRGAIGLVIALLLILFGVATAYQNGMDKSDPAVAGEQRGCSGHAHVETE